MDRFVKHYYVNQISITYSFQWSPKRVFWIIGFYQGPFFPKSVCNPHTLDLTENEVELSLYYLIS